MLMMLMVIPTFGLSLHLASCNCLQFALKADGSVVWLDKGKGSWIMRTKSRDISIYRNFFLNWGGLRIYSAKLLNNTCDMYLSGVIKGWQPFLPLSKMGTWQAVRR